MNAINQNASRAGDEVDAADSALQSLSDVLARARELAVQMGNDSYSAADRAGAATEIDGLVQQAVTLMNTNVNGRYIFGGNQDQTAPFDTAGNYNGDTAVRQVEVAPGVLEDSSVRADVAVKGVGGGVDLFATLQSLSTALRTNNGDAIRGSLTDLDDRRRHRSPRRWRRSARWATRSPPRRRWRSRPATRRPRTWRTSPRPT